LKDIFDESLKFQ